jgi:hypothetical protein
MFDLLLGNQAPAQMRKMGITRPLSSGKACARRTAPLTQHPCIGKIRARTNGQGTTMLELLKFIHFFGLIIGIGGGIANAMAAKRLASVPSEARPMVGMFRESLGKLSTAGLILLWLSGLAMVAIYRGSGIFSDPAFSLKMAAVIVLTGFSVAANVTVAQAKKAGGPPDMQRMKIVSMGALTFGLLALLLAVIQFS